MFSSGSGSSTELNDLPTVSALIILWRFGLKVLQMMPSKTSRKGLEVAKADQIAGRHNGQQVQ